MQIYHLDNDFHMLEHAFNLHAKIDPQNSFQLAVYHKGKLAVDLTAGYANEIRHLQTVFSCTKGMSALSIALLVEQGQLDLTEKVTKYWPEFAANGKEEIRVFHLLSHTAGLPEVDGLLTREEILDDSLAEAKFAQQRPLWRAGAAGGYHAFTIGTLMSILVRRITGKALTQFFDSEIRIPYGIDFRIGMPLDDEDWERFDVIPAAKFPTPPTPQTPFEDEWSNGNPSTLINSERKNFTGIPFSIPADRQAMAAGIAGAGGAGSALGLAKAYASAVYGTENKPAFLSQNTIDQMRQLQFDGVDVHLGNMRRFGIVFQLPNTSVPFGPWGSFGHDGIGGCIGFADPRSEITVGFTQRIAPVNLGVDPKVFDLIKIARNCIGKP
jgi:CubicO group peptidase (beta-lactamase class C family)